MERSMMTTSMPAEDGSPHVRLETRFGVLEADTRDTLTFPEGLPGFERCRRFVLLSAEELAPLHCLHGIEGPPASFLAIDPRLVLPDYRCVLTSKDRARIGAEPDTPLVWLALLTIDSKEHACVNLRAPVVVNPARMVGFQVIPRNALYPLRHPLTVTG